MYSHDSVPKFYHIYDPKRDRLKAFFIALYFLSVILPFMRAAKGYSRFRDPAWFLHPLIGLVFVLNYAMMALRATRVRSSGQYALHQIGADA